MVYDRNLGKYLMFPWSKEIEHKFNILKGLGITKLEVTPALLSTPAPYTQMITIDLGVSKIWITDGEGDPYSRTLHWIV